MRRYHSPPPPFDRSSWHYRDSRPRTCTDTGSIRNRSRSRPRHEHGGNRRHSFRSDVLTTSTGLLVGAGVAAMLTGRIRPMDVFSHRSSEGRTAAPKKPRDAFLPSEGCGRGGYNTSRRGHRGDPDADKVRVFVPVREDEWERGRYDAGGRRPAMDEVHSIRRGSRYRPDESIHIVRKGYWK